MRWPIRAQLLVPMLAIVVLTIGLASAAVAWWRILQVHRQQEENLRRVTATLVDASFPLSPRVLRQMSSLAGAELVLIDADGHIADTTLELQPGDAERLGQLRGQGAVEQLPAGERIHVAGRNYVGSRVPLVRRLASGEPGFLIVLYGEDRWSAAVAQAVYPSLLAGLVMVVAGVAVTLLLARRFVRPIHRLRDQAAAIAGGDFRPVPLRRRDDELRDLAQSLNRMAEQLSRYETQVRRHERLRTLDRLGAAVAHTLRNLATGAAMAVELHEQECAAGQSESLQVALRQLRLIESYVKRFLALGRAGEEPRRCVELAGLIEEILELLQPACRHARVQVDWQPPAEPVTIQGEPDALRQLLINLLLNAVEAAGHAPQGAGRVMVELDRAAPDRAVVRVKDSGPGPPEKSGADLFEAFATTKPEGTGLGLFVARQVAESHGGTIRWERTGGMTCFRVELPASSDAQKQPLGENSSGGGARQV